MNLNPDTNLGWHIVNELKFVIVFINLLVMISDVMSYSRVMNVLLFRTVLSSKSTNLIMWHIFYYFVCVYRHYNLCKNTGHISANSVQKDLNTRKLNWDCDKQRISFLGCKLWYWYNRIAMAAASYMYMCSWFHHHRLTSTCLSKYLIDWHWHIYTT